MSSTAKCVHEPTITARELLALILDELEHEEQEFVPSSIVGYARGIGRAHGIVASIAGEQGLLPAPELIEAVSAGVLVLTGPPDGDSWPS